VLVVLLVLVAAVPAAAARPPLLLAGRLAQAPKGTQVLVAVDVLGESGRIPVLATARTDAAGRFALYAAYDARAARAARQNGGSINFELDAFTRFHRWTWEFSRRWSGGRWVYDGNGPLRGVVITAIR
jgi:hypothetical protein